MSGEIERKRYIPGLPTGVPAAENAADATAAPIFRSLESNLGNHESRILALEKRLAALEDDAGEDPNVPTLPALSVPPTQTTGTEVRIFITETYAQLNSLQSLREGDFGYTKTNNQWFGWRRETDFKWRALHVWVKPLYSNLNGLTPSNAGVKDGDIGYALDKPTKVYYWGDDHWNEFGRTVVIAATFEDLNALTGIADGAQGYIEDRGWNYSRQLGAWRLQNVARVANSAALLALTLANSGIQDGDVGFTEDTKKHYLRQDDAWQLDATLTSTLPVAVGITNAAGTGATGARIDHVHSSDFRINAGKGEWRNGPSWNDFTHFT